jgi:hypothetical protein
VSTTAEIRDVSVATDIALQHRVRIEAVQAGLIGIAARLGVSRRTLRDTGIADAVLGSWYRAV